MLYRGFTVHGFMCMHAFHREDIYALKYSLVQNAIDAQRLVVAIGHWEATHHQSVQPSTQVLEENASNEKEELQIPSGSTTPVAIPAEPLEARRELTTLIADKQRMEAKQKRLERQLTEVDSQYDIILQVRDNSDKQHF